MGGAVFSFSTPYFRESLKGQGIEHILAKMVMNIQEVEALMIHIRSDIELFEVISNNYGG